MLIWWFIKLSNLVFTNHKQIHLILYKMKTFDHKCKIIHTYSLKFKNSIRMILVRNPLF